jgi:hypothetical protein
MPGKVNEAELWPMSSPGAGAEQLSAQQAAATRRFGVAHCAWQRFMTDDWPRFAKSITLGS